MADRRQRIWEFFMGLTGLDQFEIQKELNPIIKKLKIDLNNVDVSDIRKIVVLYAKNTLEKRLKSVAPVTHVKAPPNYNHN